MRAALCTAWVLQLLLEGSDGGKSASHQQGRQDEQKRTPYGFVTPWYSSAVLSSYHSRKPAPAAICHRWNRSVCRQWHHAVSEDAELGNAQEQRPLIANLTIILLARPVQATKLSQHCAPVFSTLTLPINMQLDAKMHDAPSLFPADWYSSPHTHTFL